MGGVAVTADVVGGPPGDGRPGAGVAGGVAGGLPFSAVIGQEEAKLALLMVAADRRIGGVLLRGDKGSAKTTLARGLAALLGEGADFVELPIGATEDRVVGTLDVAAALTGGVLRFAPGLLATAHGGVLYVDEINLLPDHLVDVLLDVAASGVNRVEREGLSHTHPSDFVLIGSMNPEEGDLRPQLLDRFGLAVEVRTSTDPAERAAAVRRRLAFDANPLAVTEAVAGAEVALAARLASAQSADLPSGLLDAVVALCAGAGAEGLRADLAVCRASAALAGWEGRAEVTADDIRRVAPLALAHRARRNPLDPAGIDRRDLDEALERHLGSGAAAGGGSAGGEDTGSGDGGGEEETGGGGLGAGSEDAQAGAEHSGSERPSSPAGPTDAARIAALVTSAPRADRRQNAPAAGRRAPAESNRGRLVGNRAPSGPIGGVAIGATVRGAAARRAADPSGAPGEALVAVGDLREAVRSQRSANLIVVAVDASGSMGAEHRMAAARETVLSLLLDAYQRRDLVSLVAFRVDDASVLLRPTGSTEVARARLAQLPTGGRTPLAAGIRVALDVAVAPARAVSHRPLIVVITDGRATSAAEGDDPVHASLEAAAAVRRAGVDAVVVDVESPGGGLVGTRLGLAARVATAMDAQYVRAEEATPSGLRAAALAGVRRYVGGQ